MCVCVWSVFSQFLDCILSSLCKRRREFTWMLYTDNITLLRWGWALLSLRVRITTRCTCLFGSRFAKMMICCVTHWRERCSSWINILQMIAKRAIGDVLFWTRSVVWLKNAKKSLLCLPVSIYMYIHTYIYYIYVCKEKKKREKRQLPKILQMYYQFLPPLNFGSSVLFVHVFH